MYVDTDENGKIIMMEKTGIQEKYYLDIRFGMRISRTLLLNLWKQTGLSESIIGVLGMDG